MSCISVDSSGNAQIRMVTNSGILQTVTVPVSTPPCELLDPVSDSLVFGAAFISLIAAVWGTRALYRLFTRDIL
jgi:hypothetical protein